jgi:hypothetical protein
MDLSPFTQKNNRPLVLKKIVEKLDLSVGFFPDRVCTRLNNRCIDFFKSNFNAFIVSNHDL